MKSVLILESPSLDDINGRRWEGDQLKESLRLLNVAVEHRFVTRLENLVENMSKLTQSEVLHIAGHGSEKSFGFTDETRTEWDGMALGCLASAAGRLVCISSCHSESMNVREADKVISSHFEKNGKNFESRPRAIILLSGLVPLSAAVLVWSVFYWHLARRLAGNPILSCPPRLIYESLLRVKAAGFGIPMCAHYWSDRDKRFIDISPWKNDQAEENVKAIEEGRDPRILMFDKNG